VNGLAAIAYVLHQPESKHLQFSYSSRLRGLVLHGKMYISNDDAARRKATALEARVYLPMRVCTCDDNPTTHWK
jgi:hypothetical protein